MQHMSTLPWVTLTIDDLNDAKAATLIAAVQTSALAVGQGDPIPTIIDGTVADLRGAIGFSGKYQLSATPNTIPPNLYDLAVQNILRSCKARLEQQLSQGDIADESNYQKRLTDLIAGRYPVDKPDDPMSSTPSTPLGRVSEVQGVTRLFTRSKLDGL